MTIRSGGRPRDTRQAHPIEPEPLDEPWEPDYRHGRGGSRVYPPAGA